MLILSDELCLLRAVMHDPEMYPDPMEFKPERFLRTTKTDSGELKYELSKDVLDPSSVVFGYGRR